MEFTGGEQQEVSYNTLAEHLYSPCNSKGDQYQFFREVFNHQKNKSDVDKEDLFTTVKNKKLKKGTLTGWDLEVEWKGRSTLWIPLKKIKILTLLRQLNMLKANPIILESAFDVCR